MNIKFLLLGISLIALQSCTILNVKQDNFGTSKSLDFTKNKKWIINDLFTDLDSYQREEMNKKIFETFNSLSKNNAVTLQDARTKNLLTAKISRNPADTEIEDLKNTSDFDYLVTAYTVKVNDQISLLETSRPIEYKKNEAFATIEVYDIKNQKKIYIQKAYDIVSLDKGQRYPEISGEEAYVNKKKNEGPFFTASASQISKRCLKKILKDIRKNAVK